MRGAGLAQRFAGVGPGEKFVRKFPYGLLRVESCSVGETGWRDGMSGWGPCPQNNCFVESEGRKLHPVAGGVFRFTEIAEVGG